MEKYKSVCPVVYAVIWVIVYVVSALVLSRLPCFVWYVEVLFQLGLLLAGAWVTGVVVRHECSNFVRVLVLVIVLIFYIRYFLHIFALDVLGSVYTDIYIILFAFFILVWMFAIVSVIFRRKNVELSDEEGSTAPQA